jgi:hypothetical protein
VISTLFGATALVPLLIAPARIGHQRHDVLDDLQRRLVAVLAASVAANHQGSEAHVRLAQAAALDRDALHRLDGDTHGLVFQDDASQLIFREAPRVPL